MECPTCQTVLVVDANFCHHCGAPRPQLALGQTTKLAPPTPGDTWHAGSCPLCGSTEVYRQRGGLYPDCTTNLSDLKLTGFENQAAPLITYVCLHCGAVALFLTANAPIETIRQQWQRVEQKP